MKKLTKRESKLRELIKGFRDGTDRSIQCLQREIERGVSLRQSLESKAARVDVLEVARSHFDELLKLLPEDGP